MSKAQKKRKPSEAQRQITDLKEQLRLTLLEARELPEQIRLLKQEMAAVVQLIQSYRYEGSLAKLTMETAMHKMSNLTPMLDEVNRLLRDKIRNRLQEVAEGHNSNE